MTITLEASPHALAVLEREQIRYEVLDPVRALAGEKERGAKFRAGSPKHALHLERVKRLEEACTLQSTSEPDARRSMSAGSSNDLNANRSPVGANGSISTAPVDGLSSLQTLARDTLIALNRVSRTVAEKAVRAATGSTAEELTMNALKQL